MRRLRPDGRKRNVGDVLNEPGAIEISEEQYEGLLRNLECKALAGLGEMTTTLQDITFDEDTGEILAVDKFIKQRKGDATDETAT